MTLKNGVGNCSLVAVLSANGWKDQNMTSSFSPSNKTLIWRRHCSIGQSCCSMTSKRGIGWFPESSRAWSFFTRALVKPTKNHPRLYPFDKPIKSFYFRSFVLFVLFARFHFKVIRKSLYVPPPPRSKKTLQRIKLKTESLKHQFSITIGSFRITLNGKRKKSTCAAWSSFHCTCRLL